MRINPKKSSEYSFFLRPLFASQIKKYGKILDPTLLWARIPRLYIPFLLFFSGLTHRRSLISKQIRTLVSVRISQINWCPFCVDFNSMLWTQAGGADEKIANVESWRTSSAYSEIERAALDFAEAVTITDRKVDDALFNDLRRIFGDDGVVELTALIAFQNMSSKFNSVLEAAPSGMCQIGKRDPLA